MDKQPIAKKLCLVRVSWLAQSALTASETRIPLSQVELINRIVTYWLMGTHSHTKACTVDGRSLITFIAERLTRGTVTVWRHSARFFRAFVSGEWKSLIVMLNYRFDSYQSDFPSQSDQFFSVLLNVVDTELPFDPGFHLTLTLLIIEKQIKTYGSFRTMLKISSEHGIILIESPSVIWLALLARNDEISSLGTFLDL